MTRKSKQRSRQRKRTEREMRKRLGMEPGERICGEGRCCQFMTREGKKCSREASYHLNMKKAKLGLMVLLCGFSVFFGTNVSQLFFIRRIARI